MKKKLNGDAGFTLVEMLAATAVLILLTMMLGTGLQMTMRSYQKITAQSEVDLLLSTAMDALVDDLRFARYVDDHPDPADTGIPVDDDVPFTYTSDSFVGEIHLELDETTGQIMARDTETSENGKRFLSTGVYGGKPDKKVYAYKVTKMKITHDEVANTFTIDLEVRATADESIKASGTVTVRCLNEMTGN